MTQDGWKGSVTYDAALYLRLSKDDMNLEGRESSSIENQRELLRNFVKSQPDIRIFDVYADDGYSGSNFDRPEFKRMTKDIEAGKVNCVIVKDLSRFGREYIEAGRWIQKTYPALNVRFIAVTDHFDSETADFSERSFVVPVKNFVNDSYCRDISAKVKSHQQIKRERGEFIGAFAPYGYEKSPEDKNRLVADEYAAAVVQMIFSWKIEGFSLGAIARKLNDRQILSPKEYKRARGENYNSGHQSADPARWSAVQVRRILTNEVYIGNMVQGKEERISYKVKKRVNKPKSEWVKVENTHPPVIRKDDFYIVQKLLQYDGRASKTSEQADLFTGFLICGDCQTPMVRRVNQYKGKKKCFYICQTKNKGGSCTRHSISEETLKKIVLKEIQTYTSLLADQEQIMEKLKNMAVGYESAVPYDMEILKLQEEYRKVYGLQTSLYDDLKKGMITKEEFEEFREAYGKQREKMEQMMEKQKQIRKGRFERSVAAAVRLQEWKKSFELKELDRFLLALTVDKIQVYEGKKIAVALRYQDRKTVLDLPAIGQEEKEKEAG